MSMLGAATGGFLGSASVELFADTRPLVVGLEKGRAETIAATGQMSKSTASFSKFSLAAYATAGAAVAKFAMEAIKAAQQHEIAVQRLAVAARGNTVAFLELAHAQMELTGFTTDSIIAAETQLARLHLTEAQMRVLLPLTEDYARATGKDLVSAAATVEKAILGNSRGLKELGASFKLTGTFAQNFGKVQKFLAQQVGGSAAAYLKTTAGQLDALNAKYEELKIQVGQGLTPVLAGLLNAANALLPLFQALGFIILTVVGAIRLIVAAALDLTAALRNMANSILEFIGLQRGATESGGHFAKAMGENTTMLNNYLAATDTANTATREGILASKDSAAAMKAQKTAADALRGGLLGLVGALAQVHAGQKTLNDLRKQGKKDTQEYKDAELNLLQLQLGLNTSLKDYVANLQTSGKTQEQVVRQIEALGQRAGLTKNKVDALLGSWMHLAAGINATPIAAHINIVGNTGTGYHISRFAEGTNYAPGGLAWVGERGPELVSLPRGAAVTPSGRSGGTTIVVNVQGSVTSERDLIRSIQQGLIRTGIRNGGHTGL